MQEEDYCKISVVYLECDQYCYRFVLVIAAFMLFSNQAGGQNAMSRQSPLRTIDVSNAPPPIFTGRWDFIPTIAPDSVPAKVLVTPNGDVWIAANGGVPRRTTGRDALLVEKRADGRSVEVPAIISNDMIGLGDDRVLVSTIWQEIFIVSPEGIREINPRSVSGGFTFADLPEGRLAIGLDDWRIEGDFASRVAAAIDRPVLFVPGAERLVTVGESLFAIIDGRVKRIDLNSGLEIETFTYTEDSDSINSVRAASNGRILIATSPHYADGDCFAVSTSPEPKWQRVFDGACYDFVETAPSEFWASTAAGIFWFDDTNWRTFFTDAASGIGRLGMFAATNAGSLWIETTEGLWRYYMLTREIPTIATTNITTLLRGQKGRLFIGEENGAVTVLDAGTWRKLLPPAAEPNAYSRMPILKERKDGTVLALHPSGLVRLDDAGPTRIADGPPEENSIAPMSMAVCPDDSVFVGLSWITDVIMLVNGKWQSDFRHTANGVDRLAISGLTQIPCRFDGKQAAGHAIWAFWARGDGGG